jgi:hypothetical protein
MNLFENHHLIPESLKDHPVFLALRKANTPYDRFTLKMPTAAAAAQSSQIASAPLVDGVREFRKYNPH